MATVKFVGAEVHTIGTLPTKGSKAPDFVLVGSDLQEIHLAEFKGKRLVINIFPAIDTGVCATSVRNFNKWVSENLTLDTTLSRKIMVFCSPTALCKA